MPELETIPLLRGLPDAWRTRLGAEARPWHAREGTLLFEMGDPCGDFTLLTAGAVRVTKPLGSGQEILLYRLHPGEVCVMTTACFLGRSRYPVRGVAETRLRGVVLPGPLAREMVAACEPFREALFVTLAERLSGLMALLEDLMTRRLDHRLAAVLIAHGPIVCLTHQQLANELVSAREVVSRLLEHFEARGLVALRRGRIEIVDPEALALVAGPRHA